MRGLLCLYRVVSSSIVGWLDVAPTVPIVIDNIVLRYVAAGLALQPQVAVYDFGASCPTCCVKGLPVSVKEFVCAEGVRTCFTLGVVFGCGVDVWF